MTLLSDTARLKDGLPLSFAWPIRVAMRFLSSSNLRARDSSLYFSLLLTVDEPKGKKMLSSSRISRASLSVGSGLASILKGLFAERATAGAGVCFSTGLELASNWTGGVDEHPVSQHIPSMHKPNFALGLLLVTNHLRQRSCGKGLVLSWHMLYQFI